MQSTKSPYRRIRGLSSAKLLSQPPTRFKTEPKLKGARAKGKTYERLVGRKLQRRIDQGEFVGELVYNQWFSFEDANGSGLCQTDYYLICPGFIILLECKLTQTDSAKEQLTQLYKPVLQKIYQCPVVCVQVCKNLRKHPANAILDIKELIEKPRPGIWTWHFIG